MNNPRTSHPRMTHVVYCLAIAKASQDLADDYKPGDGLTRVLYYDTREQATRADRQYARWGWTTWQETEHSNF